MSEDKDSKTEAPSEKKIRDAIEEGNIPFSREAPTFASILGLIIILVYSAPEQARGLAQSLTLFLEQPRSFSLGTGEDVSRLLDAVSMEMGRVMLPAILILLIAGLAASAAQNAPRIVGARIQPKWARISPAAGWKRVFGVQGLVEFAKGAFKLVVIGGTLSLVLHSDYQRIVNAMFDDPSELPTLLLTLSVRLVSSVSVVTVALVAADLVWSRLHWHRDLRMSRQEVKDEFKQLEGDPLVKGRLRALTKDRARRRMLAAVPRATMVLTNPTHFAIALRYERDQDDAPIVLAKGQDLIALRIREVAARHGIEIIEDKPLVHAMYKGIEINQAIPPEFYRAVANLLVYVLKKRG